MNNTYTQLTLRNIWSKFLIYYMQVREHWHAKRLQRRYVAVFELLFLILSQIAWFLQFLAVCLDHMLIPVEGVLLVAVECSAVFVLLAVNIDKSVPLLVTIQPAQQVGLRPCTVSKYAAAIIASFFKLFDMTLQVIDTIWIMNLSILELIERTQSVF